MVKAVVGTVVALAVIGGGGYLVDNAVRDAAEKQVATTMQTELGLSKTPTVSLGGFPFSLAVITRSVPNAEATADRVPLEISGHPLELTKVLVTTGRISVTDRKVEVAEATATAMLSYKDLENVAGVPVSHAGNGRLELRYPIEVLGRRVSAAVSALPRLDVEGAVIRLTEPKLDLAGSNIDISLSQDQLDRLVKPIDVTLDHDLRLTAIRPAADGVGVEVGGEHLTLALP